MKKVLAIIMGLLICFSLVGCGSEEAKRKPFYQLEEKEQKTIAMNIGQNEIKATLKNPDESKFELEEAKLSGKNTFTVSGFVTATNSFNAKVKNPYIIKIEFLNDVDDVEKGYAYKILDSKIGK